MKMTWQSEFENIVEAHFNDMKSKNHRLSVRGYAHKAKLSAASVSRILGRQEWSLSHDRATEALKNLRVDSDKINHMAVLASPELQDTALAVLKNNDAFLADPFYIPTLLAHDLNPQPGTAQIAKSLGLSQEKLTAITNDLIKLEHLETSEGGKLKIRKNGKIKTGDGPSSELIRQHHAANFDLVKESLLNDGVDDRDVSSITMTGNSQQIEEVKKEIRQFYQRINAILNHSEEKDEVFKVVVGFMPMKFSKTKGDKND